MTRRSLTGRVSLLSCLNVRQRFIYVTSVRLSNSRSILFKHANNFSSVLPNRLDHRIYEIDIPTRVSCFFFFICYLLGGNVTFFGAQNFPFYYFINLPIS